jgi:8-oxo-dGTP pyrophosphatase MutT (NUDIX family)
LNPQEYQSKVRETAIPAVYLFLLTGHERGSLGCKILMMLRRGTGYMDGMWDVPSGHIEAGEVPTQAMQREAKEEIGIILVKKDLELVHTSYRPKHDQTGNRADYAFKASRWRNQPRIIESDKCEKMGWFWSADLPKNTVPHVREFIRFWRKGIAFSEFNLRWLKTNGEYKLLSS